jgi:hypothetical protein
MRSAGQWLGGTNPLVTLHGGGESPRLYPDRGGNQNLTYRYEVGRTMVGGSESPLLPISLVGLATNSPWSGKISLLPITGGPSKQLEALCRLSLLWGPWMGAVGRKPIERQVDEKVEVQGSKGGKASWVPIEELCQVSLPPVPWQRHTLACTCFFLK